ncbi:MAG TPA: methyltransferase domain-containing protein [Candidatus Bilamarchaeum sp.]|nr:methyltransferase domain-containing protein [Candidatus Bilamarchaeum sp.]
MGGRERRTNPRDVKKTGVGFEGKAPLADLLSADSHELRVERLFDITIEFAREKREHHELILKAERAIHEIYGRFEELQRVKFLGRLYDQFALNYDAHMGEQTGHYRAIRRVLGYAEPYLSLPVIDLSAGTGEPMGYAVEIMAAKARLRLQTDLTYQIHMNEISPRMLEIAERKHGKIPGAGFTDYSAYTIPEHLKGRFRTVLCSQTFHIISEQDKPRMVESMRELLVPGGHAVVIEEDPFRITQTPSIEPVSMFLRSVVDPIKNPGKLIGYFVTHGFRRVDESAHSNIDSEHAMHLHIFQKK